MVERFFRDITQNRLKAWWLALATIPGIPFYWERTIGDLFRSGQSEATVLHFAI